MNMAPERQVKVDLFRIHFLVMTMYSSFVPKYNAF